MLLMFLEVVEVFDDENELGEEEEGRKEAAIYAQKLPVHPPLSGSHVPKPMVETTKWGLGLSVTDVNEAQHCPSIWDLDGDVWGGSLAVPATKQIAWRPTAATLARPRTRASVDPWSIAKSLSSRLLRNFKHPACLPPAAPQELKAGWSGVAVTARASVPYAADAHKEYRAGLPPLGVVALCLVCFRLMYRFRGPCSI